MAGERSIQHVSNQDAAEVDGWVELGMGIMAHYGVEQSDSIDDNLDNVYFACANEISQPYSDEQVQVGLGAVFGSRLSYKHGSQWQRVVDAYGSDYGSVMLFHCFFGYQAIRFRLRAGTQSLAS